MNKIARRKFIDDQIKQNRQSKGNDQQKVVKQQVEQILYPIFDKDTLSRRIFYHKERQDKSISKAQNIKHEQEQNLESESNSEQANIDQFNIAQQNNTQRKLNQSCKIQISKARESNLRTLMHVPQQARKQKHIMKNYKSIDLQTNQRLKIAKKRRQMMEDMRKSQIVEKKSQYLVTQLENQLSKNKELKQKQQQRKNKVQSIYQKKQKFVQGQIQKNQIFFRQKQLRKKMLKKQRRLHLKQTSIASKERQLKNTHNSLQKLKNQNKNIVQQLRIQKEMIKNYQQAITVQRNKIAEIERQSLKLKIQLSKKEHNNDFAQIQRERVKSLIRKENKQTSTYKPKLSGYIAFQIRITFQQFLDKPIKIKLVSVTSSKPATSLQIKKRLSISQPINKTSTLQHCDLQQLENIAVARWEQIVCKQKKSIDFFPQIIQFEKSIIKSKQQFRKAVQHFIRKHKDCGGNKPICEHLIRFYEQISKIDKQKLRPQIPLGKWVIDRPLSLL